MLKLNDICAGYGEKEVLKSVSLEVSAGELISIIGPNGSGKSTLLKVAMGILAPFDGEIIINGTPSYKLTCTETAKRVSYLAQSTRVPDMTVRQSVLHGRFPHLKYPRSYGKRDCEIAAEAIEKLGLSGFSEKPLAELSGGMRQKAYIARALAQDTDCILLDEPAAYLDISAGIELMKVLRALASGGKCIVAVMHDLPLALAFSNRTALLHNGRLAACDTPERLCDSGIIRDVFGVEVRRDGENCYYCKY